jgi:hypothetical protein
MVAVSLRSLGRIVNNAPGAWLGLPPPPGGLNPVLDSPTLLPTAAFSRSGQSPPSGGCTRETNAHRCGPRSPGLLPSLARAATYRGLFALARGRVYRV